MSKSSNLPPGVSVGMIPGNRPEDLWYERFVEHIAYPSGLDYVNPEELAQQVTRFLGILQWMNKDAFKAGIQEGKMQGSMEEGDKVGEYLERLEDARRDIYDLNAAMGKVLDSVEDWHKMLLDPATHDMPDDELIGWLQDQTYEVLTQFHGDYYVEKED